jgi:SAM-dependent methyltransferase
VIRVVTYVAAARKYAACDLATFIGSIESRHLCKTYAAVSLQDGAWNMNRLHHWLCRSARWERKIEQRVRWVMDGTDLGNRVLELGPGPGLSTDLLRDKTQSLTAIELDARLAERLRTRLLGSNVQVVSGDATTMPFAEGQFSGSACFTMLHHVPSAELQDKVLHEVCRVLKPGGMFVGSDSLQSWFMRVIHIGDTLVPIDPDTFGTRLMTAGFEVLDIQKNAEAFRFRARRPADS